MYYIGTMIDAFINVPIMRCVVIIFFNSVYSKI